MIKENHMTYHVHIFTTLPLQRVWQVKINGMNQKCGR